MFTDRLLVQAVTAVFLIFCFGSAACRSPVDAGDGSSSADPVQALAGAGAGEASGSSTADSVAVAGNGSGAVPGATTPTTTAASDTPTTDWNTLMRLIPSNADALFVIDFARVIAAARTVFLQVTSTELDDATIDELARMVMTNGGVPAEITQRLVPSKMGAAVLGFWSASESVVLFTSRAGVVDAPVEGGGVQTIGIPQVQMVARGESLVIGLGAAFTEAQTRDLSNASTEVFPGTVWAEGWNALPEDAALRIFIPTMSALPDDVRARLGDLQLGEVRRGALGLTLDGALVLLVDADSDEMLRRQFAGGWQFVERGVEQIRAIAPAGAQGWVRYVEMMARGLFSHVSFDRAGTVTTLRIRRSDCSPSVLLPAAILGFVVQSAKAIDANEVAVWAPIEQPLATSCARLPGPVGSIPRSLVRLTPSEVPAQAVFVAFDYAALLRDGLPTGFGLLPYSLRTEDVSAAITPASVGLSAWDVTDGSGAIFVDMAGSNGVPTMAAVLPASSNALVPPVPDPSLVREVRPGLGLVIAPTATMTRLAEPAMPTSDYNAALTLLPASTNLAVMVSGGFLAQASAMMPAGAITNLYGATRLLAIGLDGIRPTGLVLVVTGDANALAAAAQADLVRAARETLQQVLPGLTNVEGLAQAYSQTTAFRATDANTVVVEFRMAPELSYGPLFAFGVAFALGTSGMDRYRAGAEEAGRLPEDPAVDPMAPAAADPTLAPADPAALPAADPNF